MHIPEWEKIVRQIEQELNPVKVAELAKKLNEAMLTEEKEKVKRRLGIAGRQNANQGANGK
jgi:hypothetical protein